MATRKTAAKKAVKKTVRKAPAKKTATKKKATTKRAYNRKPKVEESVTLDAGPMPPAEEELQDTAFFDGLEQFGRFIENQRIACEAVETSYTEDNRASLEQLEVLAGYAENLQQIDATMKALEALKEKARRGRFLVASKLQPGTYSVNGLIIEVTPNGQVQIAQLGPRAEANNAPYYVVT